MSTVTVPSQRSADLRVDDELDSRFEMLAHAVRQVTDGPGVDFGSVFDLDYGHAEPAVEVCDSPEALAVGNRDVEATRIRRTTPARPESRPVRLTRRGRVALTTLFLVAALGAMVALGGWATASLTGGTPEPVRVIEVQPGQTLYDIAGEVAAPGHVREMVLRIQQLNSLSGASIEEGQKLAVPAG